jgi:mono/diheme cytochrome c family protein
MKPSHVIVVMGAVLGLLAGPASYADPRRDAILAELLAQAKKEGPGFNRFAAERGAAFYRATHQGGKPGTASCTSCHGSSPLDKGQTRAGKDIDPMAVSKSPARYTDTDNVEKWFGRNCNDVLGRPCTAREKGDFITYMMGQ